MPPTALPTFDPTTYFGSRTVSGFAANLVEPDYLKMLPIMWPRNKAKLLQKLSLLPTRRVSSKRYNYFTEYRAPRGGGMDLYADLALTTPVAVGTSLAAGDVVYIRCTRALAGRVRQKSHITLQQEYYPENERTAYVSGNPILVADTAGPPVVGNSIIPITMITAAAAPLGFNFDRMVFSGSVNEEGSTIPDSVSWDPNPNQNVVSTFRTPVRMTADAIKEQLRVTEDPMQQERRRGLRDHSEGIETAFWVSEYYDGTLFGNNTCLMRGIIPAMRDLAPNNFANFYTTTDLRWAGQSWLAKGKQFFESYLEQIFSYVDGPITCECGSGFLLGIQQMCEVNSNYTLTEGAVSFGIAVKKLTTVLGDILLEESPVLTENGHRFGGFFSSPDQFTKVIHTDTALASEGPRASLNAGGFDGEIDEWMSKLSLQFMFPEKAFYMTAGLDNIAYDAG